jgi:hypothetical protein
VAFTVDVDRLHRRQVDDDAVVADGVARDVVPAAPHGEREPALAREAKRGRDVLGAAAARYERRPPIDGAIPDPPRTLVRRVIGSDELPGEPATERRQQHVFKHGRTSPDRSGRHYARTRAPGKALTTPLTARASLRQRHRPAPPESRRRSPSTPHAGSEGFCRPTRCRVREAGGAMHRPGRTAPCLTGAEARFRVIRPFRRPLIVRGVTPG